MKKLYDLLGGRKATFGILLFVVVLVLLLTDKVNGAEWLTYTQWIFASFVVGNGLSYACRGKSECTKE